MEGIYAANSHIVYMALLHALEREKIALPAVAPTFFATVAKLLGKEFRFLDIDLTMRCEGADVVSDFYETFQPNNPIVFQSYGEAIGEARVHVMKMGDCVKILSKESELLEKVDLFLRGGIKKGRLWNYDVVSVGIKDKRAPCNEERLQEAIEASNEIVRKMATHYRDNPYFDILPQGTKTLKSGFVILLKPELYCPKEDIYQELHQRGVDVRVRFKPLYRLSLFSGESLRVSEDFYKAVLILPLKEDIISIVDEVFEKYRYRGCRF